MEVLRELFENRPEPIWNETAEKTVRLWLSGVDSLQIALRRRISESTVIAHLAKGIELGEIDAQQELEEDELYEIAQFFIQNESLDLAPAVTHFEGRFDYDDLAMLRGGLGYLCRHRPEFFDLGKSKMPCWRLVLAERNDHGEKKMGIRWVVAILRADKWSAIQSLRSTWSDDIEWCREAVSLVMTKKFAHYSQLKLTSQILTTQTQVEAYREAYRWVEALGSKGQTAEVHAERTRKHSVYAMKMYNCWEKSAFRKANAHLSDEQGENLQCLYVGQTGGPIYERYNEHIGDGELSSKWGRDYFYEPFEDAHDSEVKTLMKAYSVETGVQLTQMSLGESLIYEAEFGEWLKEKGYAVYYR